MRLLNANSKRLKEFIGDDNAPPYAILSHTWEGDEVTLQDLREPSTQDKLGWIKISYCCNQAIEDGFEWVWIDTCCIDKSSSAELSEAINSMFRWYQKAVICYVYLTDYSANIVFGEHEGLDFWQCRWFSRGWTLQELLAPESVNFYSQNWTYLGSKDTLCTTLSKITGIEPETLQGEPVNRISIARRMSWAAKRTTTRTEDLAYSLLGIFDVNMPLLYGEGEKSFFRLQEEIIKSSSDQSLFAWARGPIMTMDSYISYQNIRRLVFNTSPLPGLLAESPSYFESSSFIDSLNLGELERRGWEAKPTTIQHKTIYVHLPVITIVTENKLLPKFDFMTLGCRKRDGYAIDRSHYIGVAIRRLDSRIFFRYPELVLIPRTPHLSNRDAVKHKSQPLSLAISSRGQWDFDLFVQNLAHYCLRPRLPSLGSDVYLFDVHCGPSTTYNRTTGMIWSKGGFDNIDACLLFKCHSRESAFSVAIAGACHVFCEPSSFEFELKNQIYVQARRIHYNDDVPTKELTSSIFKNIGYPEWEKLPGPDASTVKPSYQETTDRHMKLDLGGNTEVSITTQWINWQGSWHEDLTIDVIQKPDLTLSTLSSDVKNSPKMEDAGVIREDESQEDEDSRN